MRLTTFTDYCLRVLMYVAVRDSAAVTIDEIAESYGISRNHLMKVVFRLGQLGYLSTVRGRGGGMRLARSPGEINLGLLIRQTEEGLALVECFREGDVSCAIAPGCRLKGVLGEALDAFLAVLDGYTLADLLAPRRRLAKLLGVTAAG
jgi:Rrf2 family nitric oxide-sensitive transcriptional repressor